MTALLILIFLIITAQAVARRDPFAVPAWFRQQAFCIESHENGGYGWHAHTGNGYETGLQFLPNTWARAGGHFSNPPGHFYGYTVAEIIYRAYRIYRQDNGSWQEWSTRGYCGLR